MQTQSGLNLTQAAFLGRMTIKFGLISLVVLMVGRVLISATISYWVATHPPAPPPPTVGFGKLPAIAFPEQTSTDKPAGYELQLPSGRFPRYEDRAKVFLLRKTSLSLLADQRAKEVAANYGFVFQPSVLNERTYRWTKSTPLQSTLEMNIQNNNFSINTNFLSRVELLSKANLPEESTAVNLVKSFVSAGQQLPSDIATVSGEVSYLKALGGDLTPAISFSDADFVQVDLNRAPIDNSKPMYTPGGTKGTLHAILAGGLSGKDQIVQLDFKYQAVDYQERYTYPLRTAAEAWQIIQSGEGFIANKGKTDTSVIREVSLGYFDSFDEQEYLQPIYVFSGDDGFLGYVPAVDPAKTVQLLQ